MTSIIDSRCMISHTNDAYPSCIATMPSGRGLRYVDLCTTDLGFCISIFLLEII